METIVSRMGRVYRILRVVHGVYVLPLFAGWIFANLRLFVGAAMMLDRLLFPSLRSTKADRPIVLVGNPRTGTTFLQRFLSAQGFGSGVELFLSLYPSLLIQYLGRPFLPLFELISPARWHSTEAHHTSLSSVETDDVAVLFRYFDGFFLYGFFLSFDDEDLLHTVDPKVRDTAQRDFDWLEAVWSRSLVLHGADRNIAKLFSLAPRLGQFMERFPNAQILYTVRDPVSVIPSSMSLVIGVLDRAFGFWSKPDDVRQRWLDRMYAAWIMLFRRFHDDWTNGTIPHDKVFIVRYDRMMQDFDGMMEEMCEFLGHEMTPELRATIADKADKQRSYKSKHKYDLAKFGLDEARIRKDCAFVYETFLPEIDFDAERAKRAGK
jgi:omega-hydroxy-beta-dihydromenaquinone-9 sulfotransferase